MGKYILKRTLNSILTVMIVFVAVFMLLRLMPLSGYFPQEMLKETDEATRMTYLRNQGLLDHPLVQLGRFIANLFKGDAKSQQEGIAYAVPCPCPDIPPQRIRAEKMLPRGAVIPLFAVQGYFVGVYRRNHGINKAHHNDGDDQHHQHHYGLIFKEGAEGGPPIGIIGIARVFAEHLVKHFGTEF